MKVLNLGIAGLGTVGSGVVKLLNKNSFFFENKSGCKVVLKAVCFKKTTLDNSELANVKKYSDAYKMIDDVDVFVELIGGTSVAKDLIVYALKSKKHVITANKALLSEFGKELSLLAKENNVELLFEASVAGGIPAIKVLRESLYANNIYSLVGILNGTSNYILSTMENEGKSYNEALKEAKSKGYAESDPALDVGGGDASHKLNILFSIAFEQDLNIDSIFIEGIEKIKTKEVSLAKKLGYKIKHLCIGEKINGKFFKRVHPALINKRSDIAVDGVNNSICFYGDQIGKVILIGPGAGSAATASSISSDIVDLVKNLKSNFFGVETEKLANSIVQNIKNRNGKYFISGDLIYKDDIENILLQNSIEIEKSTIDENFGLITSEVIESLILRILKDKKVSILRVETY